MLGHDICACLNRDLVTVEALGYDSQPFHIHHVVLRMETLCHRGSHVNWTVGHPEQLTHTGKCPQF